MLIPIEARKPGAAIEQIPDRKAGLPDLGPDILLPLEECGWIRRCVLELHDVVRDRRERTCDRVALVAQIALCNLILERGDLPFEVVEPARDKQLEG